jgi:ABC-2 type transport system ATP-binding protein
LFSENKSFAIEISNLHKSFGNGWGKKIPILKNINLSIYDNEIFGYLGSNGAGKTTTFKIILGLIFADKGSVSFWGNNAFGSDVKEKIGYLPENAYFYSHLTAQESLEFYAGLFWMEKNLKKKRISELIDLVGLKNAGKKQLKNFSRGMLQRLGIAQAMINDPKLLILDEPMSGLDPVGRKEMRNIISDCRDNGKTIIFSSHILSDVEMICDRACILKQGSIDKLVDVREMMNTGTNGWEIVFQGKNEDFISSLQKNECFKTKSSGETHIVKTDDKEKAYILMNEIKAKKFDFISFNPLRKNLEDIYVKKTE